MYDGELRYTDDVLRGLFDELETLGFLADALVVVTSDHGEEFADHGGLLHRVSLYDELLHVPLILFGAGVPAAQVERLVSSIDIAPTILAAAGLEASPFMAGEDLQALARRADDGERAVFSQYADLRYSIRTPRWKLIESPASRRLELYDLENDPAERHDLAAARPERVRRLHRRLRAWRSGAPKLEGLVRPSVEIPREESERLRALGYVE